MARIVHVANMYGPKSGGLRTSMHALGHGYLTAGHDFVMIVPGRKLARRRTAEGLRIEVPSVLIPKTGGYRLIVRIGLVKKLLSDINPDRLEISDRLTLLSLAKWAKKRQISCTLFAHERLDGILQSFIPALRHPQKFADFWNHRTTKRVDQIVCTTNYAAAEFERIQAQNVKMIPLGVDLSRFSPELADLAFRRNLVGDQKMVVACTRLSKEKDPDFLLDIAAEFKHQKLPITLVIAGSGPMERQLYSRVAEDQLPVKFLGFIQDSIQIAKILASSDVFLAVGPIETFGLAALESLACGTPVISRLGGAISEITSEDCAKSLVRDEKAWVDAVKEFTQVDPVQTRAKARARAEQFDWAQTTNSMLKLHVLDIEIREAA